MCCGKGEIMRQTYNHAGVSRKRVRTWALNKKEAAQIRRAVLRFGLDRRRVYTIGHDNGLEVVCHFTGRCSGCACDCHPGCSHGAGGCSECGYTGKRRQSFGDPVRIPGHGFVVCALAEKRLAQDLLPMGEI